MFVCISIETCITKVFVSPVANKALTNHVITSRKVTSAENCEIECFLEMKCESYNLGPQLGNGDHVCELSNSDAIRDPLDLMTNQGFIYRGTKVEANGVKKNERENPLLVNGTLFKTYMNPICLLAFVHSNSHCSWASGRAGGRAGGRTDGRTDGRTNEWMNRAELQVLVSYKNNT